MAAPYGVFAARTPNFWKGCKINKAMREILGRNHLTFTQSMRERLGLLTLSNRQRYLFVYLLIGHNGSYWDTSLPYKFEFYFRRRYARVQLLYKIVNDYDSILF